MTTVPPDADLDSIVITEATPEPPAPFDPADAVGDPATLRITEATETA